MIETLSRSAALLATAAMLALLPAGAAVAGETGPAMAPAADMLAGGSAAEIAESVTLDRIAFGSCLHQGKPQPIWDGVLAQKPQLMLMIGDNVYGDFAEADAAPLANAYAKLGQHADFAKARRALPMLAIWDDHDYGKNDGGAEFAHRTIAAEKLLAFWRITPERPLQDGIHYSRVLGPEGKRVQIIMLDTRSMRSPLKVKSDVFAFWGRYEPDADAAKTMLGAAQWTWLEGELAKEADVRIVVSSIQVLAEGHGWERWGNLPLEQERLLQLLAKKAKGALVLLSGDRHAAALYAKDIAGREIVEATSSSMNLAPANPNQDARQPPLASEIFSVENFGLIAIDWEKRALSLSLRGMDGGALAERVVPF